MTTDASRLCCVASKYAAGLSAIVQLLALLLGGTFTILLFTHIKADTTLDASKLVVNATASHNETNMQSEHRKEEQESIHRLLLNSSHSTMDNDNASDFPLPSKIDHPPYDVNMSDVQPQELAHNGTFTIGPGPRGWTSIDLLQLIRISSIVHIVLNVLWLLTIPGLLATIKTETLMPIALNACVLTITLIYAIIHALFITVLIFYQTLYLIYGTASALFASAALAAYALVLVTQWYRYIQYITDGDECGCLSRLARLVKGRHQESSGEYSVAAATYATHIPYADDEIPPRNQAFSQF